MSDEQSRPSFSSKGFGSGARASGGAPGGDSPLSADGAASSEVANSDALHRPDDDVKTVLIEDVAVVEGSGGRDRSDPGTKSIDVSRPLLGDGPPVTNKLAVVSLVSAFFLSPVAVITGHVASAQIKRSNGAQKGRGLAIAGTVLGYVGILALVAALSLGLFGANPVTTTSGQGITPAQEGAFSQPSDAASPSSSSSSLVEGEEGPDTSQQPTEGVTGHALTPEFCETFNEWVAVGANYTDLALSPGQALPEDLVAAYEKLASVESPNQAVYQQFAEFVKDPASAAEAKVVGDFTKAAQFDAAACA